MNDVKELDASRRQFITKIVPACALTCVSGEGIFAMTKAALGRDILGDKHKFDAEFSISARRWWASKGRDAIALIHSFVDVLGKDKVIEVLKQHAYNRAKGNGERYRKRKGTNDFETFKTRFIGPGSYSDSLIEAEVVENSPRALEIKVTECVIAEIWVKMDAGEYGHAYNCWDLTSPKLHLYEEHRFQELFLHPPHFQ